MVAVLADIGGTHVRFALCGDNGPENIKKHEVSAFKNVEQALAEYSADKGKLYIATAAWPHADGTWQFARPDRWIINPDNLEKVGWSLQYIGNDFGAGARGAVSLGKDELHEVQAAGENNIPQDRAAVLGSGTGLGMAFVRDGQVYETYGGQMEVPQRTDEQHTVVWLIKRLKEDDRPVSAEDIISGPGLVFLYQAACMIHGQPVTDCQPDELLKTKDEFLSSFALRLYHEFLGLFAHQAVIYGHAYKALYLDGGVLHRLVENSAFDTDRFLEFFIGDPLPLIKKQIEAMPVNIVTDPYVTLRGLAQMVKHDA